MQFKCIFTCLMSQIYFTFIVQKSWSSRLLIFEDDFGLAEDLIKPVDSVFLGASIFIHVRPYFVKADGVKSCGLKTRDSWRSQKGFESGTRSFGNFLCLNFWKLLFTLWSKRRLLCLSGKTIRWALRNLILSRDDGCEWLWVNERS